MNTHKSLIRNAILLQLDAASPSPIPQHTILQGLKLAGHNLSEQQLLKELNYLTDLKFISSHTHTLSHASLNFALTAHGTNYLEKQNLI